MLVKLTDTKGRDYWVNPIFVRMIIPKGDQCEVRLSFNVGMSTSVRINQPAEQFADTVSSALASFGYAAAAMAAMENEHYQQQQQAAAAAAAG